MIFANDKLFHNIQIEPLPFTTSDHLPIICTVTAKTITIPITPSYNTTKANLGQFTITDNKIRNINTDENMDISTFERKFQDWYYTITNSMKEIIPVGTKQIILLREIRSPLIKQIMYYHNILQM